MQYTSDFGSLWIIIQSLPFRITLCYLLASPICLQYCCFVYFYFITIFEWNKNILCVFINGFLWLKMWNSINITSILSLQSDFWLLQFFKEYACWCTYKVVCNWEGVYFTFFATYWQKYWQKYVKVLVSTAILLTFAS